MENRKLKKMERYFIRFAPDGNRKAGMFLCLRGWADVLLNGQPFHLERGMLHVIAPLVVCNEVARSDDFEGVRIEDELEVFYAVVQTVLDTVLRLRLRNTPCIRLGEEEIAFLVARKRLLDEKLAALQAEQSEEGRMLQRRMIHLLEQEAMLEVIGFFLRSKQMEPPLERRSESVVYHFIYALHAHFRTERSVAFYANEAQLSTGHFTALVKQETGQTPSEWIVAITIAHAKLQLERSKKSIKEIADELHFPEQFTFRKYFKQYVGVPPSEYRLQMLRKKELPQPGDEV